MWLIKEIKFCNVAISLAGGLAKTNISYLVGAIFISASLGIANDRTVYAHSWIAWGSARKTFATVVTEA